MKSNPSPLVITGLGLMTGLGVNLADSWQGLIAGKSVTAPFRSLDPARLSCPFGVELPPEADALFQSHIKKRKRSQMTRSTQIGLLTAEMAIADAQLDMERLDRSRVGVVLGSTGTSYIPDDGGKEEMRILKNMPNAPVSWISLNWKLHGPSFIIGTACSSGVYAMGAAYGLIRSGQCDVVLCGSVDSSLNYPDIEGFCDLLALAEASGDPATASRPFDARRSGFVIGEGGGILVLESLDHARRREARIYAQMHYPGFYTESYNILSPEPGGKGMAGCMQRALQESGLTPSDIDYINAHGTSTNLNDLYETLAIKTVFADRAREIPVSSTKSMTGHCLAGSGGVEAVISCKALSEGIIPPTINLTHPDPRLDLDYVPLQARKKDLHHVMSNSFAFGGHNGVNIFSGYGHLRRKGE
jgi:3-oxoacyl-[acyl-carrier-protein] synthase II